MRFQSDTTAEINEMPPARDGCLLYARYDVLLSVLLRFDYAVVMFFMSWRIGGWVYLANIYIPCQTLSQVCRPGQTTNKVALRLDRL